MKKKRKAYFGASCSRVESIEILDDGKLVKLVSSWNIPNLVINIDSIELELFNPGSHSVSCCDRVSTRTGRNVRRSERGNH
jgi:hypothetical protein